jgi:hypothetical protein
MGDLIRFPERKTPRHRTAEERTNATFDAIGPPACVVCPILATCKTLCAGMLEWARRSDAIEEAAEAAAAQPRRPRRSTNPEGKGA